MASKPIAFIMRLNLISRGLTDLTGFLVIFRSRKGLSLIDSNLRGLIHLSKIKFSLADSK